MSKRIAAFAFFESSAKTREGVKDVFQKAAHATLLFSKPQPSKFKYKVQHAAHKCSLL